MNAIPDSGDESEAIARKTQMEADGIDPQLPACGAVYMCRYLFEIGPVHNGQPILHSEIESWQRLTGIRLNAWESRTLRRLSCEYVHESREAKDPFRPAPYMPEDMLQKQREAVDRKIRNSISVSMKVQQ